MRAGQPISSSVGIAKAADFLAPFSPVESCEILNALQVYLGPRHSLTSQTASKRYTRLARSSRMWRQCGSNPVDDIFLAGAAGNIGEGLGESAGESLGEGLNFLADRLRIRGRILGTNGNKTPVRGGYF